MVEYQHEHSLYVFASPSGMWIAMRAEIGKPGWVVRVLNFATYKHERHEFPDEATARTYADKWRI